MIFRIFDLETEEILEWDIKKMLQEINRDRSENWTDYNELDWYEGWDEWCEGDMYKLLTVS